MSMVRSITVNVRRAIEAVKESEYIRNDIPFISKKVVQA